MVTGRVVLRVVTDTLVVTGIKKVVTYFGVSFSHAFPFIFEIKCKTVESTLHGNRRHIYLKLSKEKKGSLVHSNAALLFEKAVRSSDLITGPGLRIWCCVMELSQLTVNFSSLPRYFPLV